MKTLYKLRKNFHWIENEIPDTENPEKKGYQISGLPITIYPEELIDKIVYYGDKKAKVVEQVNDKEFRVTYNKGKSGIMDYEEIIRQLTHIKDEADDLWTIEEILDHRWGRGKMKGKMEVLIKWKDEDESSWEPLQIIKEDDPISLAKYAQERGIHKKSNWKWTLRHLALNKTSQARIIQLYAKKSKQLPRYKFGE